VLGKAMLLLGLTQPRVLLAQALAHAVAPALMAAAAGASELRRFYEVRFVKCLWEVFV